MRSSLGTLVRMLLKRGKLSNPQSIHFASRTSSQRDEVKNSRPRGRMKSLDQDPVFRRLLLQLQRCTARFRRETMRIRQVSDRDALTSVVAVVARTCRASNRRSWMQLSLSNLFHHLRQCSSFVEVIGTFYVAIFVTSASFLSRSIPSERCPRPTFYNRRSKTMMKTLTIGCNGERIFWDGRV